jgi:hypothetical protein
MRSGSGFPAGVHCVMELYLDRTRHTRLVLVLDEEAPPFPEDDCCSRELSGLMRMATVEHEVPMAKDDDAREMRIEIGKTRALENSINREKW